MRLFGYKSIVILGLAFLAQTRASAASLAQANQALLAGDLESALASYEQLAAASGEDAEAAEYLGAHCLFRMDSLAEARERLQGFRERHCPRSEWCDDTLMDLAAISASDSVFQDLRQSLDYYEELLRRYPEGPRALAASAELGKAAARISEWKQAEQAFYGLLSRSRTPEQIVRARLLIAALFSAEANPERNYPRALNEFEKEILARYPQTEQLPEVYFGQGEAYRKLREFDKAVGSYRTILERWPQHSLAPLAQSMIALCHESQAQFVASRQELSTIKGAGGVEFGPALAVRGAALDQKEQIQILADNTLKQSDSVTLFSGDVRVLYAGLQIDADTANYDAQSNFVTFSGPARLLLNEQQYRIQDTRGRLKLDPQHQLVEMPSSVEVQPPMALPACPSNLYQLRLRTAKLTCATP